MIRRPGLAPWQLRAWLTVAVVALIASWTLFVVGSVSPRPRPEYPPWVMDGSVIVDSDPTGVSGPNGEQWYLVHWQWRDVVIESVHSGPWAKRDAQVLIAVLTARMTQR